MKVLVTGFDPFGGESINPAYEAVKLLGDHIGGATIIKKELPTVFKKSVEILESYIIEEKPDLVICVGQAGGRPDITVERLAINLDDAGIEDNEGNLPLDKKIFIDGENAYFSSLPIKAMVGEMRRGGLPATISNTAGTFVCNHIMYGLLYLIDKKYPTTRGGFIHVPFLPDQVIDKRNMPSMGLEDIKRGLELGIIAAINNKKDIVSQEGKTH